jgi:hypothetical protein
MSKMNEEEGCGLLLVGFFFGAILMFIVCAFLM